MSLNGILADWATALPCRKSRSCLMRNGYYRATVAAQCCCLGVFITYFTLLSMEVNKDEAERCIEIALRALENSQPKKARRFLEKAQRLFPTRRAQGERTEPGIIQAFIALTQRQRAYLSSALMLILVVHSYRENQIKCFCPNARPNLLYRYINTCIYDDQWLCVCASQLM